MELKELKIGELIARIPVIQGGMGVGVSLHRLAGAVAAEGGVGVISTAQIGFRNPGYDKDPIGTNLRAIKEEIAKAREIAKGGIIGVNIMVATRKYEEYVKAAVEAGVDLIISGAGLPVSLPEIVGAAKTKLAPIVSSLKSAQVICKYWKKKYDREPDMVVIEGPEAGGHLGFSMEQLTGEEELDFDAEIRNITEYVHGLGKQTGKQIPVVVAGGIYTREDAEKAVSLGADGVQMATRFVTTHECDAHDNYKQAYIQAKKEDIVLVKSPVGMPGRAIRNAFADRAKEGRIPHGACHLCVSTCKPQETPYCITDALVNAAEGNIDDALLFCGTNAYRAEKLEYVHDIMQEFA
ncbi:MAG: nitronate monooxygenase [Lachnospiraceae bacterium]|nr:nitronate monooxygenase [Lachnospiraceae bacterium]MBQ7782055.1 nitronate monooxygenase [Lachnospiraceae bacterium]